MERARALPRAHLKATSALHDEIKRVCLDPEETHEQILGNFRQTFILIFFAPSSRDNTIILSSFFCKRTLK